MLQIPIFPVSFAEVSPNFVTGTGDFRSDIGLDAHSCSTVADMLSPSYNLNPYLRA